MRYLLAGLIAGLLWLAIALVLAGEYRPSMARWFVAITVIAALTARVEARGKWKK